MDLFRFPISGKNIIILAITLISAQIVAADKDKADGKKKKEEVKYEILNKVVATVANFPITVVDLENGLDRYKKTNLVKRGRDERSQVLDILISHEIVNFRADEESIKVPPARIATEIKKRMDSIGVTDVEAFKSKLERELHMPYSLWKQELSYEIKKEQIIQIRVQPDRPSDKEVQNWYRANKAKIGKEVSVREIIFKPDGKGLKAEAAVERKLNAIRAKALRGTSFASLAKDADNVSPYRRNGGATGWRNISDIAKADILYANNAFQLRRRGQISAVFKNSSGYYCILYSEGIRDVPLEHVYPLVQGMLYREKQEEAFYRWVEKQRELIGVVITMDDYKPSK